MHHFTSTLTNRPGANGNARSRLNASAGRRSMNFVMVVQARESFSSYILDTIGKIKLSGISWQGVASRSDQETIELIEAFGWRSDVLAVFGKNSEPVNAALAPLRDAGIHVLAFLSD